MKIYSQIGSKERLFEMMSGVNNNPEIRESNVVKGSDILKVKFAELANGKLDVRNLQSQVNGDESSVDLGCVDVQGNEVKFTFNIQATKEDQDGVYNIVGVELVNFEFNNQSERINVTVGDENLAVFNEQNGDAMINVVSKYADFDEGAPELDEKYIDAVKKIDSYPFGGTPRTMKKSSEYGDEKPTNPDLRVKSPELDKFVDEELDVNTVNSDDVVGKYYEKLPEHQKESLIQKSVMITDSVLGERGLTRDSIGYEQYRKMVKETALDIYGDYMTHVNEISDYPKEVGKKFKIKKQYNPEKKKQQTTTNLSEEGDNIVDNTDSELLNRFVSWLPNNFPDIFKNYAKEKNIGLDSAYYLFIGAFEKKFDDKHIFIFSLSDSDFDELETLMYDRFGNSIEF